mmetsp:Transcript_22951/g.58018  ORF Transcript_22951/g.58018 Transcript_22951/m.58018 type:complete len:285 (+) Transcript_22951:303-1157(+)
MNDYMRHRAGQLHPNPHVHAQWWNKQLSKHRHGMSNIISPVKKMMTSGTPQMPTSRRQSVTAGLLLGGGHSGGTVGGNVGAGNQQESRVSSSTTTAESGGMEGVGGTRGGENGGGAKWDHGRGPPSRGSGRRPQQRPASAHVRSRSGGRPGTSNAHGGIRPPSSNPTLLAESHSSSNFKAKNSFPFLSSKAASHLTASAEEAWPATKNASAKASLRKIEGAFLDCLEELDAVENTVVTTDRGLLRRFALLKMTVGSAARDVDFLCEELVLDEAMGPGTASNSGN